MEEKIAKYMKKYGITREEAEALIADDMAVDKMKTTKELFAGETAEQKKARKEMTITASEKKHGERKVERKPNEAKRKLIAEIAEALQSYKPTISNPERQVDFRLNGIDYSITLTAHRPPKK